MVIARPQWGRRQRKLRGAQAQVGARGTEARLDASAFAVLFGERKKNCEKKKRENRIKIFLLVF